MFSSRCHFVCCCNSWLGMSIYWQVYHRLNEGLLVTCHVILFQPIKSPCGQINTCNKNLVMDLFGSSLGGNGNVN